MIIRDVKISDSEQICHINSNSLGYDYPEEKTKIKIENITKSSQHIIFVAEVEGKVAGYVHAEIYDSTYFDKLINILALAVDTEYRRLGVGKKLMENIESWGKENFATGVRLSSGYNRVDAHKFYVECGYTMRKEQKSFIKVF